MDFFQKYSKPDLWNSEYISRRSSMYYNWVPGKPTSPIMSLGLCQPAFMERGAQEPLQLVGCDYEEGPLWILG